MSLVERAFGAAIGSILALTAGAWAAGKCAGDSAHYRILPPKIGRPGATERIPFTLPCDSMIVPFGQTTTIFAASMLHFGSKSGKGGKIVVKGKLVIEGKPGNPAYLVGSVDAGGTGYVPGARPWAGLMIDRGGALRLSHARFYNASKALVLRSRDVVLKNCFFKGASELVIQDTSMFIDPLGQSFSALDFREDNLDLPESRPAPPEAGPVPEEPEKVTETSEPKVPNPDLTAKKRGLAARKEKTGAKKPEPETVASEPETVASEPRAVVSEPETVVSEPDAAPEPERVVSEPEAAPEPETLAGEAEVRVLSRRERDASREREASSFSATPWLAGGAGALAVAGAVWWWFQNGKPVAEPKTPPVVSGSLDPAPDLPEPAATRP